MGKIDGMNVVHMIHVAGLICQEILYLHPFAGSDVELPFLL